MRNGKSMHVMTNTKDYLIIDINSNSKDKHAFKKYKPRDQCKRNKSSIMPLSMDFCRRLPYELKRQQRPPCCRR